MLSLDSGRQPWFQFEFHCQVRGPVHFSECSIATGNACGFAVDAFLLFHIFDLSSAQFYPGPEPLFIMVTTATVKLDGGPV